MRNIFQKMMKNQNDLYHELNVKSQSSDIEVLTLIGRYLELLWFRSGCLGWTLLME